eukprot:gene9059-16177_t
MLSMLLRSSTLASRAVYVAKMVTPHGFSIASSYPVRSANFTTSPPSSFASPSLNREEEGRRASVATGADMSAGGEKPLSGAMLEPSLANNNVVRSVVAILAISAAAGGSLLLPATLAASALLCTVVWHTFFVGLTMFKNMPRQMFGKVQAKLFPLYFGLTTGANAIILASLFVAGTSAGTLAAPSTTAIALGVALLASMTNWLLVEPACTKVMFER